MTDLKGRARGGEPLMNFTLIRAEFNHVTHRAYVELRAHDDDGGEGIVTAILTYRNKRPLS